MATLAPPIGQPGFDLYASQKSRLQGANIVLIILPTLFVIARLASRKVSQAGFWWDDLLILLALISSYGLMTCNLITTARYGFGRHIYILPQDAPRKFFQMLYAFEMIFYMTICLNKLSILAFYRRIFPISQLRIVLMVTTATVLSYTVACLLLLIMQCLPIHAFWDLELKLTPGRSRCVDTDRLFLVSGGVNCFLDFLIVLMVRTLTKSGHVGTNRCSRIFLQPIPLLWRLRTTRSQKFVLTSIFSVASL